MRYAISYVSTAATSFDKENVPRFLKSFADSNNSQNITGLLLYSEGNFFQLIEGEEVIIKELFSRIEKDHRHNNIIKLVSKPAHLNSSDGYLCEVILQKLPHCASTLKPYLHYIEVLDLETRKAVKRVIEAMIT